MVNNASWELTDVLITTPLILEFIISKRQKYDPFGINPARTFFIPLAFPDIIIDEFDELMGHSKICDPTLNILRYFSQEGKHFGEMNK